MNTVFELTSAQMYERVLIIQDLMSEEVDSVEYLSSEYVLVNGTSIVEFASGKPVFVTINDLPLELKEYVLSEGERK
jgi:hypothetical protein